MARTKKRCYRYVSEEKKSKLEQQIEKLIEEWEKDALFPDDVDAEIKRVPILHNKYYARLLRLRRKLFELNQAYEELEFKKHLFYTGRGTPEEYKANPQNYTIPKGELPLWMKADRDLKNLKFQIDCWKEIEKALNEIIDQINGRIFKLRGILEAQKFRMAVN